MPPSIAIATGGRLQGLRIQLALLDRKFDELDYDTLRALDSDTASSTPSMTEEEINALPVHTYKVPGPTKDGSAGLASSSSGAAEIKQDSKGTEGSVKGPEDELTCTICLDQVKRGELVCSLPCLHQLTASSIFTSHPLKVFGFQHFNFLVYLFLGENHAFCEYIKKSRNRLARKNVLVQLIGRFPLDASMVHFD